MKRKMKISTQMIVVFSSVMLLSMVIFALSMTIGLNRFFQTENISRLSLYLSSLPADMKNYTANDDAQYSDIGIITVIDGKWTLNTVAKKYVYEEEAKGIVQSLSVSSLPISGSKKIRGTDIFYSVKTNTSKQTVMVITNDQYVTSLQSKTYMPILIAFAISLVLGNVVLILWGKRIVNGLQYIDHDIIGKCKDHSKIKESELIGQEMYGLTESIVSMQKTIDENESTKQEMLQNVGHDFKTPIAVIRSYAEAIYDGIEDKDAAQVIMKNCDELKEKVVRLLEITKLEYLKDKKEFETVEMKSIVNAVIDNYKHQTSLHFELDLDDSEFLGIRDNYISVIDNLINNGIRYAKTTIWVTMKNQEIWVKNDGPAISESFIEKIFQPYEKGNQGQFGLGMSIVSKTLHTFGFEIEVKNEMPGVVFHIFKK